MLRRFVFGLSLMSAASLSHPVLAGTEPPLQVIISKTEQSMTVYDGDVRIATSRVSTGKSGHTTPSGIFSILEKRRYHESNIYSNAPMPFMQRLTWSGIALHEGHVPDYPASHGCIRIPPAFAKTLFGMTRAGMHVVITDEPVEPYRIEHVNLFAPIKPLTTKPLLSDIDLRPTVKRQTDAVYEVAMNSGDIAPDMTITASINGDVGAPLRILVHRRGERETIRDVQGLLTYLGFDAGDADGIIGSRTRQAITGFKRWKKLPADSARLTEEFLSALYRASGEDRPPAGQLLVRQNFKPVFETPVGIQQPQIPLGTHFFSAKTVDRIRETAEWYALSVPNVMTASEKQRLGIAAERDTSSAAQALERLSIPADVRERIGALMASGTSLTITDQAIGPETGKGTDFITLTRTQADIEKPKSAIVRKPEKPRRAKLSPYRSGIGLY